MRHAAKDTTRRLDPEDLLHRRPAAERLAHHLDRNHVQPRVPEVRRLFGEYQCSLMTWRSTTRPAMPGPSTGLACRISSARNRTCSTLNSTRPRRAGPSASPAAGISKHTALPTIPLTSSRTCTAGNLWPASPGSATAGPMTSNSHQGHPGRGNQQRSVRVIAAMTQLVAPRHMPYALRPMRLSLSLAFSACYCVKRQRNAPLPRLQVSRAAALCSGRWEFRSGCSSPTRMRTSQPALPAGSRSGRRA